MSGTRAPEARPKPGPPTVHHAGTEGRRRGPGDRGVALAAQAASQSPGSVTLPGCLGPVQESQPLHLAEAGALPALRFVPLQGRLVFRLIQADKSPEDFGLFPK